MKKKFPVFVYGTFIILEGIFLFSTNPIAFHDIRISLGVTFTMIAIIAFIAAIFSQRKQVQFAYHEMRAFTYLIYGIGILLFSDTLEKTISYTAFLLFFYSFSEIIFCGWLLNLGQIVNYKVLITRLFIGLAIGFGTVGSIYYVNYNLEIYGVMLVLIGINTILYNPVIKENKFNKLAQ